MLVAFAYTGPHFLRRLSASARLSSTSFIQARRTPRLCAAKKRIRRVVMSENNPPPRRPESAGDGRANAGLFGLRIETNGDVLKFGVVAVFVAYAFKALLTLGGVNDLLAGQITTGVFSVASLIAWVSTYVFRVGTKGMTYAQQLRDYEAEVLKKRYEELSPEELEALSRELEEGE